MDSEHNNRNRIGTFSMREFLIDAIIVITIGLFAMVPAMFVLWALGFTQL